MALNSCLSEARNELANIDKDFLGLEKDLKYVKKDSYQNGYTNLVQTIASTCNLTNVFSTLEPLRKVFNLIFGPVGFGLLTLVQVRNFHEASHLLDELKKKQADLDRFKNEIIDMTKKFEEILLSND